MPRERARPARHQPCRRGRAPHGQDHLSRRHAVAQELRHLRPRTAVRGAPARQGSEYRPPPRCPRASALRLVVLLLRTAAQPLARRGFHHRAAAHGVLHGVQQPHLLHLYEIRRARGYRRLLHRRGVHGCDRLSEHLRSDRARARHEDHPRCAEHDRHHRDSRHRHQPVPVQGGDGHRGQAHPGRPQRRAHCRARRNELPPQTVVSSAHH